MDNIKTRAEKLKNLWAKNPNIAIVLLAAIFLVLALLAVRAGSPFSAFEAEGGNLSSNVLIKNDDAASAGSYVEYAGNNSSDPTIESGSIWITPQELASLPTSGSAWNELIENANDNIGTADLSDQDNKHASRTVGLALVAARTGDSGYYEKARQAIMSAIGTEDGGRVLSISRQIGAYAIAADIINLEEKNPSDDNQLRAWLKEVRDKHIGGHGRWVEIIQTHENSANNWGTFAGASRIAISAYLDDKADLDRAANVLRAFLGDRSSYPPDAPGMDGYFQPSADFDPSWACDADQWTGINPDCDSIRKGLPVEDISRGSSYPDADGDGVMYIGEVAQAITVQAQVLEKAGYSDVWEWEDKAVLRMMDAVDRVGGNNLFSVDYYVPWIINHVYGTNYETRPAFYGRIMGWTDWTHP